jgi:hypothetical protein
MKKYHDVMLIGEHHGEHSVQEAEYIRGFRPVYVLFEGFTNHSQEEIEFFIEMCLNGDPAELTKRVIECVPLFEAIKEIGAIAVGCDDIYLQKLFERYYWNSAEDYSKGLQHLLEQTENLREISKERENLMSDVISEYAEKGKTLAIVGRGHSDYVLMNLENKGIKVEYKPLISKWISFNPQQP